MNEDIIQESIPSIPMIDPKNNEFTLVYKKYYRLVNNSLYAKTGNSEDAADLTQEVFFALYEKYETVEKVKPWLYGTMKNQLCTYYEAKGLSKEVAMENAFGDKNLLFVNGFRETRIIIQEALNTLENEEDRSVFDIIASNYYSQREAARALGLSRMQVRTRYNRAVDLILKYLSEKKGIKTLEDLL